LGKLEEGLSTGDFKRWMKGGSGDGASLSEGAMGRGGAPSLGTLEDMLRKSPDMGISLYRGPFVTKGNLVGGGLVYWGL
jgi:hypothetical protein